MSGYSEKDWKLFRQKLPQWQERYMEKLCKEYVGILKSNTQPSDRFWELDKRIQKDKHHLELRGRMSRSNMKLNIIGLICEGVITLDDLAEFSDELKNSIQAFIDPAW